MSLNSIMKLFSPKDKVFFTLFEEMAANVEKIGSKLDETVNENDYAKRAVLIQEIDAIEKNNDVLTHKTFLELGKNFITPFDREDIHYLASALDDICDYICFSGKKINLYKVNVEHDNLRKLSSLIREITAEVKVSMEHLRSMKLPPELGASIAKIRSLEDVANDAFANGIEDLFENENDIKELIKKKEIFFEMQIASNKCEEAANVIETIMVKYA